MYPLPSALSWARGLVYLPAAILKRETNKKDREKRTRTPIDERTTDSGTTGTGKHPGSGLVYYIFVCGIKLRGKEPCVGGV